jgi:hypothetical protein
MTSSIPMFGVSQLGPHSFIFNHSITDSDGFVEKIKDSVASNEWVNVGVSQDQCMDVKANHEKSNRYFKQVSFASENNGLSLYLSNSIKMAFWSTSDLYTNAFKLKNNKSNLSNIYKQEVSYIFDEDYEESKEFTAFLFLNDSQTSSETFVIENGIKSQFVPQKGSVLIIPPGSLYKIGHFSEGDQYYAVYNFSADII